MSASAPWLDQDAHVRFEWGPPGAAMASSATVVIVDVLRFTTAVDAAVSRGAEVLPYRWKDESARGYAAEHGAVLADPDGLEVGSTPADGGAVQGASPPAEGGAVDGPSLSPVSLMALGLGDRVVLPSPNGSTCAVEAAATGATVVAACLRNVSAVATWLAAEGGSVTVIACGERWPDGSLRPALEDLLGAGAVIAALPGSRSPEAEGAAAAWMAMRADLVQVVPESISGREATTRGWQRDLAFALELDASTTVPILRNGAFTDAMR